MRLVKSKVKLNMPAIRKLDRAAYQAMVLTAEAVKTDLIQSQTMPFDTGSLQNENTFVKPIPSSARRISCPRRPTPGGCISIRNTISPSGRIQTPVVPGSSRTSPAEQNRHSRARRSPRFTSGDRGCER